MTDCHNIPESYGSIFAAGGPNSCLWLETTRVSKSQVTGKTGKNGHYRLRVLKSHRAYLLVAGDHKG